MQPDAREFDNAPFEQRALGQSQEQASQHIQAGAAAARRRGNRRLRFVPRFMLKRLDGQPLGMYDQKDIEALSFLKLYPTCQNHHGTARDVKVSSSADARTRLLSANPRCQDPHHMPFRLNIFQHLQLNDALRVAFAVGKWHPSIDQIRQQLQQQRQPDLDDDSTYACSGKKLWPSWRGSEAQQHIGAALPKTCLLCTDH